jgi:membrane fusion protein, multidrug efflux system
VSVVRSERTAEITEIEPGSTRPAERGWARRWRLPLILAGPILLALVGAVFFLTAGRFETTDNAYVQIAKAPVSASVGGRVVQVYVTENQRVKAGQRLFRLDSRDAQVSEAEAAADLAQAGLRVRAMRADYDRSLAAVAAAQDTLAYSEREAARQKELVVAGVSSRQQADQAVHTAQQARQQLNVAQQQASAALADLGGDPSQPIERHPSVLAAQAKLERARLNQSYTEVLAPADGVVTRVEQLQPGAYVNPSQTVFWLLTGQPWIEANFKEDQLAKMRVGQPVEIEVDAMPGAELTGKVASFSPGTGAVFSAIPAQNATGNWVKVTQRLPVRIAFDRMPPEMAGRAGLSAKVKVDVRGAK